MIKVENITHIYHENMPYETKALDAVSFEIEDGQFVGIIGHTGSGKSTLVQHLNGLLKPSSGRILVGGADITQKNVKLRDIRRKVGLVFQYPEYQLFEETVYKDVAFGPANLELDEAEIGRRVKEAIELVGLDYEELQGRSPFELSGGQKRRAAIAGVIAMKPEVLILDEPTAGLDPKAHEEILSMLAKIHQNENNIIILVSHNMGDIAAYSDRIIVMEGGKVALDGTPREVYGRQEVLRRTGLLPPPVMELMKALADKGADVRQDVITAAEAEKEILRWLAQSGKTSGQAKSLKKAAGKGKKSHA